MLTAKAHMIQGSMEQERNIMPEAGESTNKRQTSQPVFFSMTFSVQDFLINILILTAHGPLSKCLGLQN